MVNCLHMSCSEEQRVWLHEDRCNTSDVSLHHWCVFCGVVQNISDNRPRKMGYWMNILCKIERRFSLTQSQKRLIVKALAAHDSFDDLYSILGSEQKEVFIQTVKKYCNLCESKIDSCIF
jgi:hypothetical protein